MKFKPMTRRFRIPGNTDPMCEIVIAQNEDGVVEIGMGPSGDTYFEAGGTVDDRLTIARLGFPTEPPTDEPDPEITEAVEEARSR